MELKTHNIINNNCYYALNSDIGKRFLNQTDLPTSKEESPASFVDVYVCRFPFVCASKEIYPPERQAEIDGIGNLQLKSQKFFAWKLLEYALKRSMGLKIDTIKFSKHNGKWTCADCQFSISHCENVVAVAISRKEIGVDIEAYNPKRFTQNVMRRICTKNEVATLERLDEKKREIALNNMWTVKEAVFKCGNYSNFVPSRIDTSSEIYVTKQLRCENEQYVLSVVSPDAGKAVFRLPDDLELL